MLIRRSIHFKYLHKDTFFKCSVPPKYVISSDDALRRKLFKTKRKQSKYLYQFAQIFNYQIPINFGNNTYTIYALFQSTYVSAKQLSVLYL